MKRNLAIVLNILSLVLILEATSFFNNLLLFLIAGAVPGTNLSVSPLGMLLAIVIASFILACKTRQFFAIKEKVVQKTMPRKRYARL